MTHPTPVAYLTSRLFVYMAEKLFRQPHLLQSQQNRQLFLQELLQCSLKLEKHYHCFIPDSIIDQKNHPGFLDLNQISYEIKKTFCISPFLEKITF